MLLCPLSYLLQFESSDFAGDRKNTCDNGSRGNYVTKGYYFVNQLLPTLALQEKGEGLLELQYVHTSGQTSRSLTVPTHLPPYLTSAHTHTHTCTDSEKGMKGIKWRDKLRDKG